MTRKPKKKPTFSKSKAVKANARDRVGQPAATRTLPAQRPTVGRGAKYKPQWTETLQDE